MIGGFTACNEDDVLEEKEGLPVADGMYMAKVGVDPASELIDIATVNRLINSPMVNNIPSVLHTV